MYLIRRYSRDMPVARAARPPWPDPLSIALLARRLRASLLHHLFRRGRSSFWRTGGIWTQTHLRLTTLLPPDGARKLGEKGRGPAFTWWLDEEWGQRWFNLLH
jgi:hypothetical protein